jgi:hypothetical protein
MDGLPQVWSAAFCGSQKKTFPPPGLGYVFPLWVGRFFSGNRRKLHSTLSQSEDEPEGTIILLDGCADMRWCQKTCA